jgi:hypothetical protein
MYKMTVNGLAGMNCMVASGTTLNNYVFKPQLIDLTAMFGTTIADYIYQLEQSTEGAGVAFFKSLFPNTYYPYNEGELVGVSGLSEHKMVGFNQWDEEWEVGSYDSSIATVQKNTSDTSHIMSKNPIPVLEGMTYYMNSAGKNVHLIVADDAENVLWRTTSLNNGTFNIPSGGRFVYFNTAQDYGTTYNHDICINLSDPAKNGTYKPYVKHSYALDPSVVLRGIPKLANGKLYYDGDRYLPDGTVERRYGIVDLGTLTWTSTSAYGNTNRAQAPFPNTVEGSTSLRRTAPIISDRYTPSYKVVDSASEAEVGMIGINYSSIFFRNQARSEVNKENLWILTQQIFSHREKKNPAELLSAGFYHFRNPFIICSSASASERPKVISFVSCSPAILPIAAS